MTDPLHCLREYTIKKQPIVEENDYIYFGEYCWPKSAKTNYQVFNTHQDAAKEYYNLECLLFLLKNLKLNHVAYVNFAKENDVPFIRRPDRKKLLAYLTGEISTSSSIDASAPVVPPIKMKLANDKIITDDDKDSNVQGSPMSSTGINFSRNMEQFTSLLKVELEGDDERISKKQRIESPLTLSSDKGSFSRNDDQGYLNHDHNSSIGKQGAEDEDEIDKKPSAEELAHLLSSNRNFTSNEEFSTLQKIKQEEE